MGPERKTLFFRLVATQIACGLILLLMLGGLQVWQALRPQAGGFDRDLQFHARVVAATLDEPDLVTRFPREDVVNVESLLDEAHGFDGRRIGFQVLGRSAGLLHRSSHAPPHAFPTPAAGFGTMEIAQEAWRVLVSPVAGTDVVVVVGERTHDRWRRGIAVALGGAGPLLMAIPVVLLGGWLASRFAVRPLRQVVADISGRPAGDTRPISPARGVAEIEPLVGELNRLLQRIQQAREAERSFFADAAHELKTPLAVVATQAHLLATSATPAERQAALADIERTLGRTSRLVHQLLALAAADSRLDAPAAQQVDLVELLAERLAALSPRADEAGIELALDAPATLALNAHRDSFVSLVDNLLDNALRYNRRGGKVEVVLAATPCGCELRVADTGTGIPPGERARVFERFYRAAGTAAPGSGLGLAIVQAVATRHGGAVRVEAREDGRPGSVFVVSIGAPPAGA